MARVTAVRRRSRACDLRGAKLEGRHDEDPHPDPTVPGDGGSIQSTVFRMVLPYRDAVLAGDRARVEHLLTTNAYEGHCQFSTRIGERS